MESLGAAINRNPELFSQIADLNFARGVRNKIIHPRPANADDPDLRRAAVRQVVDYVLTAIPKRVGNSLVSALERLTPLPAVSVGAGKGPVRNLL